MEITFYTLHENTNYQELPAGRIDCGSWVVERERISGDLKDILMKGTEMCRGYIEDNIFLDEGEANLAAILRTYKKYKKILDEHKELEMKIW